MKDWAGVQVWLIALLVGVALATGIIIATVSPSTLIVVRAGTTPLTAKIPVDPSFQASHVSWYLPQARLRGGELSEDTHEMTLRLTGPADIRLVPNEDGLLVALTSEEGLAGTLTIDGDTAQPLKSEVFLEISSETLTNLVFPADDLTLGQEPNQLATRPQYLLRGGEVDLLGRTIIEDRIYVARGFPLLLGDEVSFLEAESPARVIYSVGPNQHEVVVRVEAKAAEIKGFFTASRREKLGLVDQFLNDRLVIFIWSVFGIFGAALTGKLLGMFYAWNHQRREHCE